MTHWNWSQAVGVLAFVLNVWGNLELTKVGNRGHIIRLCSNACWLVYSPLVGAWALMLNHMTFAGINVLGFVRWRRFEREGRIAARHVRSAPLSPSPWVMKLRTMATCPCESPIIFCDKCMPEVIADIQREASQ